jgi:glycosyltransferase involved in cell wall biosynthesis
LARCLDSALSQNYPEVELIVIDGQSSDGTVEIIKSYEGKLAYWELSLDTGVFEASNKGIKQARGDWIYCLGFDDYLWSADTLAQLAPHLERAHPDHTIVQAKVALVDT